MSGLTSLRRTPSGESKGFTHLTRRGYIKLLLAGISGKHPIYNVRHKMRFYLIIINEQLEKARELERLVLEIESNRLQMERLLAEAKKLRAASESIKETQKRDHSSQGH
jgi:hypothetical protein